MSRCLLTLLCLLSLTITVLCDKPVDANIISDPVPAHNPEKLLPNKPVYDSQEPVDTDEPRWKVNIRNVVSVAFVAQVVILALFIIITQPCRSLSSINSAMFQDAYGVKPWNVRSERIYSHSERRYLSKDDAVPDDLDFDTGSDADMRL